MMRSILEEQIGVELQHINLKLILNETADLDPVIPVFHSWIQDQVFDELLLDVADYRHVKDGPGIILIGHESDYSLDCTDGRLGLRYNRKAPVAGSNRERLTQATRAALAALNQLERDKRLGGKFAFNGKDIELFVNDRLLAPNTGETRRIAESDLQAFADVLCGRGNYTLTYQDDPRRLFGVHIHLTSELSVQKLLQALEAKSVTP